MKIFKIILLGLALSVLASLSASAQSSRNYSKEADDAYKYKQYFAAVDLYKKAFTKVKNPVQRRRILYQTGNCYRFVRDARKAEQYYQRAIRLEFADPVVYLYLAEVMRDQAKYKEAKEQYKEYVTMVPGDPRGTMGLEAIKNAESWVQENPKRIEVENMRRMNGRDEDFSPVYADKKYKSLIFTSTRKDADTDTDPITGQSYSAIYVTALDARGQWGSPSNIDSDQEMINTVDGNNGATVMNRKFNTLYFTRCPDVKNEHVNCNIYFSTKRGRNWSDPTPLAIVNDTVTVGHPAISRNERLMYFASDLPGGYGGKDIWVAERKRSSKPFDAPVNLGSNVNSSGEELYPTVRYLEDGSMVLYYSSNGRGGMGGLDIYQTQMVDDKWSKAENLRHPINSYADDFGIIWSGSSRLEKVEPRTRAITNCDAMGFFSSDRSGGRGKTDIYEFWIPEIVFSLEGTIRDESNMQFIPNAKVKLTGGEGEGNTTIIVTTDQRGYYYFNENQILKNSTYSLSVKASGYWENTASSTTVGLQASTDLKLDIPMEPIPKKPIELPEIRYALNSCELRAQYQDSLNGLITTMKDNPGLVIELGSHTDFRGKDFANDTLSACRARSVVDFLVTKGVARDRMEPKGYGEKQPRTLADGYVLKGIKFAPGTVLTEDYINSLRSTREKEAAHQLNRRTEMRILRDDYIPKGGTTDSDTTKIVIEVNPDDSLVSYEVFSDTIFAKATLNGKRYDFAYIEREAELLLSIDLVMDQIAKHKLTKVNFAERDSAFTNDGTVKDGMRVTIPHIMIGTIRIYDVEAKVVHGQYAPIILGKDLMMEFSKGFRDDKAKKAFILPK